MSETKFTPGPWNLIWWGNEEYPYPLSVLAANDGAWVTKSGTVSSVENARLIAAAPTLYEALMEVRDYLEDRADAEYPSGLGYPVPNEEMRLLGIVCGALGKADH